jgi:hypothetical protein
LLVQVPSYQVDDLRDVAFGCAHDDYSGPTEHWDEQRPPWMAFCFTNYVAWFYFFLHCLRQGVHYAVPSQRDNTEAAPNGDGRRAPLNGPAGFKEAESNIGKIPG